MSKLLKYLYSFLAAIAIIFTMLVVVLLPLRFADSQYIIYFFLVEFVIVIIGLTKLIYRDFFRQFMDSQNGKNILSML